ncbi:hypothetical protein BDR07DRAFT_1241804, partial [Suillus spraguei]
LSIVCCLLSGGRYQTRGDDAKSLTGSVVAWIALKWQNLVPPLACNMKIDHVFHHGQMSALLCPAG